VTSVKRSYLDAIVGRQAGLFWPASTDDRTTGDKTNLGGLKAQRALYGAK
jgi:hypothetical protein